MLFFVSSLVLRCSWHVIQYSLCFEWVSWLKSDIGDFDSLSTSSEIRSFEASPHLIKYLLLLWSQVHIKEKSCTSLCVTAQCFSQYMGPINETTYFEEENLWNEEIYIIQHMWLLCITPFISDMISFLSHSVLVFLFFCSPVLLLSVNSIEMLYSFYIFNQG